MASMESEDSCTTEIAEVESEDPEQPSAVRSLLDQLKCPTASELSRKRKIHSNPPPKGLKKGKGAVADEPHTVTPATRLKEFPDQHLSLLCGKLFCNACREHLSVKKSVITQHVNSAKHAMGLRCIASKEKREKSTADLLKKYDDEAHPSGENFVESTRINRVKVVKAFLKAGIPLNKVDCFRELLEEFLQAYC